MRIWQAQSEIRSPRADRGGATPAVAEGPPPYVEPLAMPRAESWEPGHVGLRWQPEARLANGAGTIFGGYLAALADHAAGLATGSVLEEGEGFTTSELQSHFFRPVPAGEARALRIEAKVVHRGRSRIHAEVVFTLPDGRIAAKATATQVVFPLRGPAHTPLRAPLRDGR